MEEQIRLATKLESLRVAIAKCKNESCCVISIVATATTTNVLHRNLLMQLLVLAETLCFQATLKTL